MAPPVLSIIGIVLFVKKKNNIYESNRQEKERALQGILKKIRPLNKIPHAFLHVGFCYAFQIYPSVGVCTGDSDSRTIRSVPTSLCKKICMNKLLNLMRKEGCLPLRAPI